MKKTGVIIFSVFAVLLIVGLILFLSFEAKPEPENETGVLSDAIAGENNSEVALASSPSDASGYYVDQGDGWYYDLEYIPADGYDGTFSAGFDASHSATQGNLQKDFTTGGHWKLEKGEIKLYSEGVYRSSMWLCDGYIVDSLNYFVGDISPDTKRCQSVLVSKAGESGDTQIFNLYSDGKLIMEIIRNDGAADSGGEPELPKHQMVAGTYEIKDGIISVTIGQSVQNYYIVDDGIAKWKYIKRQETGSLWK